MITLVFDGSPSIVVTFVNSSNNIRFIGTCQHIPAARKTMNKCVCNQKILERSYSFSADSQLIFIFSWWWKRHLKIMKMSTHGICRSFTFDLMAKKKKKNRPQVIPVCAEISGPTNPTSTPGLIFFSLSKNLMDALKKFPVTGSFASLFRPSFSVKPRIVDPLSVCVRERSPWSRGCYKPTNLSTSTFFL